MVHLPNLRGSDRPFVSTDHVSPPREGISVVRVLPWRFE